MLKKTSARVKKCIVFFMDLSSIFREKSIENRAKIVKTGVVHENRQKVAIGTPFLSKNSTFN